MFIDLNDRINKVIYEECNEFGYAKNQYAEVAVARATASCIFDVLNKIIIKSKIDRYKTSERKMAMDLISEMKQDNNSFKDLILFDRGYPSQELIGELIYGTIYFVMRLKSNIFKKK